jgi:hypothetical protein
MSKHSESYGFSDPNDMTLLLDFSQDLRDLFEKSNQTMWSRGMDRIEEIGSGMGYGGRDLNVKYRDRCLNICITIDDEVDREVIPRHLREKIKEETV